MADTQKAGDPVDADAGMPGATPLDAAMTPPWGAPEPSASTHGTPVMRVCGHHASPALQLVIRASPESPDTLAWLAARSTHAPDAVHAR